jgi:plasmid maintenance system antidote protein VapI
MTKEELKRELQRAGKGHIETAAKELNVHPSRLRDWIEGKEPVPEETARKVRRLSSRKERPPQ